MKPSLRWRGLALTLAIGACGQHQSLQGGQGQLEISPVLDFGQVYLGATPQKSLPLLNGGDAQLSLTVALSGDSQLTLASPATVALAEGASGALLVSLQATRLGAVQATLAISGDATAQVQVTANVIADLACSQSVPCNIQTFDPNQGACVGAASPDGTTCNNGNVCTTNQSCLGGVCLGTAVDCNDNDVCTLDYCDPVEGCQHQDNTASCQGTNPCQIYYCDPVQGCRSTPASNGTPCAAIVQCVQASVCLAGQCTGAPLPDGTPCVDQKDPCATDAKCASGVCDSPTADALVPGDILWRVVAAEFSDGDGGEIPAGDGGSGSLGWRGVAATDDLGNLYLDDEGDGGAVLVSLDVCGRERWRTSQYGTSSTNDSNGRHVLTNGIVISWMSDNTFIAQSQATGQLLWSFGLPQAGFDIDDLLGFNIGDIALSNDGVLYYTGGWSTADGDGGVLVYGMIGALLANGQTKFATELPVVDMGPSGGGFGYPLLVDENENLYTALNDYSNGSASIVSYDQTGAFRWALPIARAGLDSLSENEGVFLEPVSMTQFNSNGSLLWADTEPAALVTSNGHSPVVASDGTASVERNRDGGTGNWHGAIEDYGADGTLQWSYSLSPNESATSSHVLDANGTIYFATNLERLFAINAQTGAFVWQIELPNAGPVFPGVLALTPAGSLIASASRELFSIYAGAPLATSPWPRFRGDNANRSCPLPSTPSSPSP